MSFTTAQRAWSWIEDVARLSSSFAIFHKSFYFRELPSNLYLFARFSNPKYLQRVTKLALRGRAKIGKSRA
jgi:hypothetical protein